jgi:hypothetical protein
MPTAFRSAGLVLIACATLAGCGDGDASTALDPSPVPGTSASFALDADLSRPEAFYDLPYPGDLRLDAAGHTDHSGFPAPPQNRVLRPIIALASQRRLSPVTPFAYFRFDAPIAARDADDWIPAQPDSPVLLIGIEPGSADYARLFTTVASTPPVDTYVPPNLLAVTAPPGALLAPDTTYAFVVLRSLGDANGAPLGVPESFAQLRAGQTPAGALGARAAAVYADLWPALEDAGVDLAEVAAATVFSTGDAVAELADLSERLRPRHPLDLRNLRVDPDDGAAHERFCEIRAETTVPMFQSGVPAFDRDGLFVYGSDGLPVVQREETVPVTITLPRTAMPAGGHPLVLYFHGTGGLSDQAVDRGPVSEPGGERAKGLGPAHVLAAHGFATFGAALPLNPERYTGPIGISNRVYLNIANLGAYNDTFRQMTIEQRLLLDALSRLAITPEIVAACGLPALPAGEDGYRVATGRVYAMGQSLGAQIVTMVGAVEPRVAGVVPTGSGGYWSLTVLAAEFAPGIPANAAIALLLQVPEVRDHLHPGLQLVQSVFEAAEPLVYAKRLAHDPLPGHAPRAIYQPVAIDDPGFPTVIYNAMALASGTEQAGDVLAPSLQDWLALDDRDGVLAYAARDNARSRAGDRYTGAVVQYESDGILDGHHIFSQLDAVKYQYGCFLQSLIDGGRGTVPAPAPLASGCP